MAIRGCWHDGQETSPIRGKLRFRHHGLHLQRYFFGQPASRHLLSMNTDILTAHPKREPLTTSWGDNGDQGESSSGKSVECLADLPAYRSFAEFIRLNGMSIEQRGPGLGRETWISSSTMTCSRRKEQSWKISRLMRRSRDWDST